MRVAIIGGAGKMGQWFTHFLLKERIGVTLSDKNKEKLIELGYNPQLKITPDNVVALKGADAVLICVPIGNLERVVKEIAPFITPNQVVMDITSIKEFPVEVMHKYIKTGTILGTHPMFGPNIKDIGDQNFILTPSQSKERILAEKLTKWLKMRGFNVISTSAKRHDELMATALGLSHFIGIVSCDSLLSRGDFEQVNKVGGTSFQLLLGFIKNVMAEDVEFYAALQMSLPNIGKIEEVFCEKSKKWAEIVRNKDKQRFIQETEA
jgi:prephenate dehydrogenase